MTTQPEALRLAEELDLYATGDAHQRGIEQAAAELRRLHMNFEEELMRLESENQELLAEFRLVASHAKWLNITVNAVIAKSEARAAINKAEGETK